MVERGSDGNERRWGSGVESWWLESRGACDGAWWSIESERAVKFQPK